MVQEPRFNSALGTQPCPELRCERACACARPCLPPLLMWHPSWTPVLVHCLPCLSVDPVTGPWLCPPCWDPVGWCLLGRAWQSMRSAQLLAQPPPVLLLPNCPSQESGFRTNPLIFICGMVCGPFVQVRFPSVMLPVGTKTILSVSAPGKTAYRRSIYNSLWIYSENYEQPSEVLAMHFLNTWWLLLTFVSLCLGCQLNMQCLDWLQISSNQYLDFHGNIFSSL